MTIPNKASMTGRTKNTCSWAIGVGLVLFALHNPYQPFLNVIFLPSLGLILISFGALFTLPKKPELGRRSVWVPLLIISISIGLSGVERWVEGRGEFSDAIAAAGLGAILFGLFVASRTVGKAVWKPMPAVVVIESISIIIWGATHNWQPNGGLLSPTNYDIATGLVVFGVLVSPVKHQWWLGTVGAVGLLFSGSAEAIFVIGVLLVAVLIRRDWGWRLGVAGSAVVAVLVVVVLTGVIWKAQYPTVSRMELLQATHNNLQTADVDEIIGYRLTHWKLTMPVKPFGYGVNLTEFYWGIPHNIILVIIEQVGPIAALMWLWVIVLGMKKRETRYLWIGILALGVWDHFMATQAIPWMWVAAGVSSVSGVGNCLIFKKEGCACPTLKP